MSILASVAVPPMLRSLQNAQSVNEDKNLEEIGRALCEAIKAEGQVPNPGAIATNNAISGNKGWVGLVAPYCSMASEAIQYVYPGRTETERRCYILTLNGTPTLSSPASYAVPPTGWRDVFGDWQGIKTSFLVLISSSKPDYILACPANGTATYSAWATGLAGPAAVNWAAKEWVKQVSNSVYSATNTQIVGTITTNGSVTWTDKGQFLHVKVIPMTEVLSDVEIRNDAPACDIGYATNNVATYGISTRNTTNVWFPRGTSIQVVLSNPLSTNFFRPIQSKTSVQLDLTTNWVNKN
jgi:type II secretory pathway pseudopilin PulG